MRLAVDRFAERGGDDVSLAAEDALSLRLARFNLYCGKKFAGINVRRAEALAELRKILSTETQSDSGPGTSSPTDQTRP